MLRLLSPGFALYLLALTAVLGLVMGSFLNCLAWRLANGESVLHGRSHCARCGHTLGPGDLVPLFSYLALQGKCRYCKQPISPRYPAVEGLTALVYLSALAACGLRWDTVQALVLASCLITLSLVDLDTFVIPDRVLAVLALSWLLFLPLSPAPAASFRSGLVGACAIGLPLLAIVLAADRIMGRETMGGGDLKLLFLTGLYFGWQRQLLLLILACLVGLLFALPARNGGESRPIPFGPAISAAAWFVFLFGQPIVSWYLSLFL